MTVAELIAELQKLDPGLPVISVDPEYGDMSTICLDRRWVKVVQNPPLPGLLDVNDAKEGEDGAVYAVVIS